MVKLTKLKRISNTKGDILHILKSSEQSFTQFGEAYFTIINKDEVKGWKKHKRMEMNLVVPVGDVTFYIYDEFIKKKQTFRINRENYSRLTVPPGYWMAFEGHDDHINLILNIASIEHDPDEAVNIELDKILLD